MNNKPIYFDVVFEQHYQKRVLRDKRLHELYIPHCFQNTISIIPNEAPLSGAEWYKQALTLFIDNPHHPQLDNHELKGKMSTKRAFSIDSDCRVIYVEDEDKFLFLDIGNHDEVYS